MRTATLRTGPVFVAWLLAWMVGLAALASAGSQKEVRVTAQLTAGVLRLGDTGYLNLTVENGREAKVIEAPVLEGLMFGRVGPPSLNQSTSFVNGRVYSERTLTFRIAFRAEKEGDFEIPPVALDVDGTSHTTKPVRVTVVRDITGADFGYLEVRSSGTRVVEGQPFTVELTFGWDEARTGKVNFAELNLPWWDSLPGAIELEGQTVPQGSRVDIPVNGAQGVPTEQKANRVRDGRSFICLNLTKSFLPTRSGTLEFPTSFFEFGRSRQASLFETRRESHFVQAEPFTIEVVALPTEGQPLDFSGAVGDFGVRASADARDVRVGDSIKLTVEWTGKGNLEYFRVPDPGVLDAFRGFRVYGKTEEKSVERRKVVYDLAPLSSDVQTIPSVPLSYFSPDEGRYESVASEPIPIRVRALPKGAGLAGEEERFERDIADIDTRAPGRNGPVDKGGQDAFLLASVVAVPVVGLLARARTRRRAGDPSAPLERRRRRALKELQRALERSTAPSDVQDAMQEFLAARTRESAAAWIGRDFEAWARAHRPSMSEAARDEAVELLRGMEVALYGGGAPVGGEKVLSLARTLRGAGL